VRIGSAALWTLAAALAANFMHRFPEDPSERAIAVCRPVQWIANVASSFAASMDDRGRAGEAAEPWREASHQSCVRLAQKVFFAIQQG
jgi:hypothetical protein